MAYYPQYPQTLSPEGRPPAPAPVRLAVGLMYGGVAASVISMVAWLAASGSIKSAAEHTAPAITPSEANGLVGFYVAVAVVIGMVGAGLWLWMALANNRGRSWARVVATVLFGIYTLGTIATSLSSTTHVTVNGNTSDVPTPVAGKLATWLVWVIGLAAIIALWQRRSTAYYAAVKRHDAAGLAGYYQPFGQAPYGQPPYGALSYGQPQPGQAPYGRPEPGQAPYGQTPANNETAPHDTVQYETAPYETAPAAPSATIPSKSVPPDTARSDTAPSDAAPSDTAPSDTAPSDTAPSDTTPSGTASSGTASSGTASSGTASA